MRSDERQACALSELADAVVACRACEAAGYLPQANPIRPALLEDARMMLVGQAPGPVTDPAKMVVPVPSAPIWSNP